MLAFARVLPVSTTTPSYFFFTHPHSRGRPGTVKNYPRQRTNYAALMFRAASCRFYVSRRMEVATVETKRAEYGDTFFVDINTKL